MKKCACCGKLFSGSNYLYCGAECQRIARLRQMKKYREEERENRRLEEESRHRKPKITINQIIEIAKAENLSYGKCVAKYGY